MSRRLAVIGAGPSGLAAALEGLQRGFDVTVLEKESRPGAALRRWGPTRFFTPLGMNVPPAFRAILGDLLPGDGALLTGPEMADNVLEPLAAREPLAGRIFTSHEVTAIGRRGLTRSDFPNHPLRHERPFVVVTRSGGGDRRLEADVVFDASGGYAIPAAAGSGGIPADGEAEVRDQLICTLGALHSSLEGLAGKHVLVIGGGHSAANAVVALSEMASTARGTRVTWAVRTMNRRPCLEVANDPLEERRRIVEAANALAAEPPAWLSVLRRATVLRFARRDSRLRVTLNGNREDAFDAVAAFTGYKPDLSFLSELPLEISPVTEGPARLQRAISNVTDCLSVPRVRGEDLDTGEPGFYFVGSKSYGRAPTFLLQTGLQQIAAIFETLGGGR
jgi:thioredoxin reductase